MRSRTTNLAVVYTLAITSLTGCVGGDSRNMTVPSVAPISQAERFTLYEAHVDSLRDMLLAAHPSVTVPEAELVRFVLPSEWAPTIAGCMQASGFSTSVRADGGVEFEAPPEGQEQSLSIAYYVCSVEFPIDPRYSRPLNGEQLEFLYAYFIEELIPCLEAEGYPVAQPPSEGAFLDHYLESPWSPYGQVSPPSEDEWTALTGACPELPEALFGSEP